MKYYNFLENIKTIYSMKVPTNYAELKNIKNIYQVEKYSSFMTEEG